MKQAPVIEVKKVYKAFGDNQVLKGFSMQVMPGECVAVLGKSGSGKSVLIKCMIGLLEQDQGEIKILGKEVSGMNTRELDELRMRVGFLFQSNALYDSMSVKENLEFPLRRHRKKINKEEINKKIQSALSDVGLPETTYLMPAELSGGMKKRIALARTIIMQPEIILYDEPTTGLDPITGKEISLLMKKLSKHNQSASLVISHDIHCVKIVADRIILLVDGIARSEGTYDELIKNQDPEIQGFFT